jgi:hypothetical protein
MNTYQRQLLDKLISELTDNASSNLHAAQMLASELKGAMQAQDAPQKPTPDADGWVENSGVDPNCMIAAYKVANGSVCCLSRPFKSFLYPWSLADIHDYTITHYRPA